MYIYLFTYCELKLLHDHCNILHNAHYACLTSTTLLAAVWNSSWPFSCTTTRLYMVSHCAVPPTTVCWRRKSVDLCDQLMHGHVSYHGPGPSLVTGALLWLDRRSWTRTLAATDNIYGFRKQLKTYFV